MEASNLAATEGYLNHEHHARSNQVHQFDTLGKSASEDGSWENEDLVDVGEAGRGRSIRAVGA
jgi:hypothetical protein